MLRSRISNVPFLDGADDMYATSNKSHFKLVDATVKSKREVVLQPVSSLFKRGDQKYLAEYQTETALSFPSHPPAPVVQPNLTHLNMQRTNFKLHSGDRCGDYEITQSELKPLPMCAAKIIRPTTTVRTSLPEDKYPEPTYRSSYIKHKVSRIFRAKQSAKTGVGSSLIMDRRDRFRSSYHEQFQYRWYPRPPETEKQQIQYSSVVMGDQERQWTNKQHIPPHSDSQVTTGPVHFECRCPTLSSVFKGETLTGDQQRLSTTNQFFFPKINRSQFPVHVDGASIRTLSSAEFGRPDLAGSFYSTATQEQFPPKEVVPPKPPIYPPSHVLSEQEPDWMLTTMKKDFVPLNCKRQNMSPSQLHQVKDSHIRPQHSKHDFRTIHNEAFVPKPYCKASLEKPPLQHISHVPF